MATNPRVVWAVAVPQRTSSSASVARDGGAVHYWTSYRRPTALRAWSMGPVGRTAGAEQVDR